MSGSFQPTKVNEARFGYNSLFNNITQQLAGTENVDAEIGVPVKITDKNSWGIPNIVLGNNLSSFGNPTSSPFQINDKVYQGIDNFSWVIGKHSLRMGGEYRYNKFPQVGNEFPRGQFFFTGAFTGNPNTGSTGYAGADFLQDYITQTIIAVSLVSSDFRNSEWAAYVDDTWKVTSALDRHRRPPVGGGSAAARRIRPWRKCPAQLQRDSSGRGSGQSESTSRLRPDG